MNSKPSWKDAPEWANWLAQDADGHWWWHESRPYQNYELEEWFSSNKQRRVLPENKNWDETLEAR